MYETTVTQAHTLIVEGNGGDMPNTSGKTLPQPIARKYDREQKGRPSALMRRDLSSNATEESCRARSSDAGRGSVNISMNV